VAKKKKKKTINHKTGKLFLNFKNFRGWGAGNMEEGE
jgi:hypothetical protein